MKIVIFIVVLLFVSVPYPTLDAPEWNVLVVDSQNKPIKGVSVRENYMNYSIEKEGHEVNLVTGNDGKVLFPAVTIWKNVLLRSIGFVGALDGGAHASFGPHDYVSAGGASPVKNGYLEDWTGRPDKMSSVIVLH